MWPFDPRARDEAALDPLFNNLAAMDGLSRAQIDRLHTLERHKVDAPTLGRVVFIRRLIEDGRLGSDDR